MTPIGTVADWRSDSGPNPVLALVAAVLSMPFVIEKAGPAAVAAAENV